MVLQKIALIIKNWKKPNENVVSIFSEETKILTILTRRYEIVLIFLSFLLSIKISLTT
jgi:hypothetical protein